jgi:Arc/MetJ-type ribon-helix-helix transcriptional regulator
MEVKMTKQLDDFVQRKVRDGGYVDESDVVRQALRLWMNANESEIVNMGVLPPGGDIAEMCFVVLMAATNDQDKDLQLIMAEVRALAADAAMAKLRDMVSRCK